MTDKSKRAENQYSKPRTFVDDEPIVAVKPESKSWDEYEAASRIVKGKALEIQKKLDALVKEWAEFEGATVVAYKRMPFADTMFSDSPISPQRMQNAFRQNLAKLGWKWAAGLPWGPENVRNFYDVVAEACTWGERILKDKSRRDKIETATKAAEKAKNDIGAIV